MTNLRDRLCGFLNVCTMIKCKVDINPDYSNEISEVYFEIATLYAQTNYAPGLRTMLTAIFYRYGSIY